ncbi:MAG: hypothetical protein M3Y55_02725 [Pseudomonadota bacterium]|nr:hypothetical protein [Pseudomonadota bacterium]
MSAHPAFRSTLLALAVLATGAIALPAAAQTTAHAKTSKAAPKAMRHAAPVEAPVPDASPDQVKAAEMVYYGKYDCEFNQKVDIVQSVKHLAYVDVKDGKSNWLMKPVLSSTGAIRLEDVRGETLMVQIASKSMLLNVKTGHRIVDACISPKQRELIEAAKAAKAAEASASASS